MSEHKEAKWVVFTKFQLPAGQQWNPTLREGVTKKDIDGMIEAIEYAQSKFSEKDWTVVESGGAKAYTRPAQQSIETQGADLGNCEKCGAPMKLSKAGKPYCSKTCWLKEGKSY